MALTLKQISAELLRVINNPELFAHHIAGDRAVFYVDGLRLSCLPTKDAALQMAEKYAKPLRGLGGKPFEMSRAYSQLRKEGPYDWNKTPKVKTFPVTEEQ